MLKTTIKAVAGIAALGFLGYGVYSIDFSNFSSSDGIICILACGMIVRLCD